MTHMKFKLPLRAIVTGLVILIISLLIWFGGPMVQINGVYLLKNLFTRIMVIASIVMGYGTKLVLQHFFSKKAEDQFVSSIVKSSNQQQAQEVKRYLVGAIKELKKHCLLGNGSCRSLYELPRYLVFGSSSAGKSTLLKNSGMNFLGLTSPENPGIQAAQGINWHITNEAIFIEITGDEQATTWDAAINANIQFELIEALKKYRTSLPVSGVVFVIDICTLFAGSEENYRRKLEEIKGYAQNLVNRLNTKFPLYLVFAKCDLLAGFLEYFGYMRDDDLKNALRIEIPTEVASDNFKKAAAENYDALVDELVNYLPNILHQEMDLFKRKQMMLFPQQLALLKDAIIDGIDDVLIASKLREGVELKGIFFTSASQEGCVPSDLLDRPMAKKFGLSFKERAVEPNFSQCYFATNIFKEIIATDNEEFYLAEHSVKNSLDKLIYALLFSALPIGIIGMTVNYTNYQGRIIATQEYLKETEFLKLQQDHDVASIQRIISILNRVQGALDLYPVTLVEKLKIPTIYPRQEIRGWLLELRRTSLEGMLLPFVANRLHELIGVYANDPKQLYDAVRAYLVLKWPTTLPNSWLKKAMVRDIQYNLSISAEDGKEYERYLDLLLSTTLPKIQVDESLINRAIVDLRSFPLEERIYSILRERAGEVQLPDLNLSQALGAQTDQVFKIAETLIVQGLYTNNGYVNFYLSKLPPLVKKIIADFKLMGITTEYQPSYQSMMALVQKVNVLYFNDYVNQWKKSVDKIQMVKCRNLNDCLNVLNVMKAPDSPLINFLKTMELNASVPSMDVRAQRRPVLDGWYAELKNRESQYFGEVTKIISGLSGYLNKIVQDDNVHRASFLAVQAMIVDDNSLTKDDLPLVSIYRQLTKYPEPMRSWLKGLVDNILSILVLNAKQYINEVWQSEVLGKYKNIQGYFPFNGNSELEVGVEDFANFFAPIGVMGNFWQTYLLPFIDINKSPWQWKKIHSNFVLDSSDKSLEQIDEVFKITNNLFLSNTKNVAIEFYLRPLILSKNVASFQVQIGEKTMNYSHGPQVPVTFKWPCAGQSQIRLNFRDFKDQDSTLSFSGFWALLKFLDAVKIKGTSDVGIYEVVAAIDNEKAHFTLGVSTAQAISLLQELKYYSLPGRVF